MTKFEHWTLQQSKCENLLLSRRGHDLGRQESIEIHFCKARNGQSHDCFQYLLYFFRFDDNQEQT